MIDSTECFHEWDSSEKQDSSEEFYICKKCGYEFHPLKEIERLKNGVQY